MEQLLLDFEQLAYPMPTLENFIVGDNAELLTHLEKMLSARDHSSPNEDMAKFSLLPQQEDDQTQEKHSIDRYALWFLFGATGSGKTHLLTACSNRLSESIYLDVHQDPDLSSLPIEQEDNVSFIALDNIEQLTEEGQQRVFHLCNLARKSKLSMMVSAHSAPAEMMLRQDLLLRFAHGLVFFVSPLSDDQKMQALKNYVEKCAMPICDEVLSYLLSRTSRNLSSLMQLLELIDRASLISQQKPTLPMVRGLLKRLSQKRE